MSGFSPFNGESMARLSVVLDAMDDARKLWKLNNPYDSSSGAESAALKAGTEAGKEFDRKANDLS